MNQILFDLEKILDDWDPIGILQDFKPINYSIPYIGEYHNYVLPLVRVYLAKHSIYHHLKELHESLVGDTNEIIEGELMKTEYKITEYLSHSKLEDLLSLIK